jgi:membrane associated rhomboid family serine protease
MFPYHDENETQRPTFVTWILIGANVVAWLGVQGAGTLPALAESVCSLGLIPGVVTGAVPPGTLIPVAEGLACVTQPGRHVETVFTSMFLHGSWVHLLGNMWFLFLFGNNVEDSMGHRRFLGFYLLTGVAAALLQIVIYPGSAVPMVGASGAISGVMGAYLVLYPRVRVWTIVPIGFFLTSIPLPAWTMLLFWFAIQLVSGVTVLGGATGGVAFWAHVGGFVAGAALVRAFARRDYIAAHRARHWRPRRTRRGL